MNLKRHNLGNWIFSSGLMIAALMLVIGEIQKSTINQNLNPQNSEINLSSLSSQYPAPQSKGFKEITAFSGIPIDANSQTVNIADYDNDGWTDVIFGGRLYKNVSTNQRILFEDQTSKLNLPIFTGHPMFIDLNSDGLLDIVSTEGIVLVQKSLNTWTNQSEKFVLPKFKIKTFAFADINKDSYPDLLIGRDENYRTNEFFAPILLLNNKGQGFSDRTPLPLKLKKNYTRSISFADYNNDGKLDVYLSNYRLRANQLFKIGSRGFVDVAEDLQVQGEYNPKKYYDPIMRSQIGPTYGHTISSIWVDLNNDGNLDLWVSNLVHKFNGYPKDDPQTYDDRGYRCDDSAIFISSGPGLYKFKDIRFDSGIPYKPMGDYTRYNGDEVWAQTTAGDFDNDGLQDVYVSQVYNKYYAYSYLFKNLGGNRFQEVSYANGTRVYNSYAAAWGDFNNDGKLDLIQSGQDAVDKPARVRVLQNITENKNHYLKIKLVGTKSGTIPVGAQVRLYYENYVSDLFNPYKEIKTGYGIYMRQVDGVTGTLNQQNDNTLHFGLSDINFIDKLEIRWPSGKVDTIYNIQVDRTLTIREYNVR